MIALAEESRRKKQTKPSAPTFEKLLPTIRRQASVAFAHAPSSEREELVAEVVANCIVAYVRLVERGLGRVIYATPLTQYAILQVCSGRKVGTKLNVREVSSEYCQHRKGVKLTRLDCYNREEEEWREVVVEDRTATPADIAATRIDFADWLKELAPKARQIANTLATGESTSATAKRHGVSAGRISQMRGELHEAWLCFQGELDFA